MPEQFENDGNLTVKDSLQDFDAKKNVPTPKNETVFFLLYPLKDYNMNLQPTLLYKITILYSYTILLETIPRGAKDYDYPEAN